MANRHTGRWFWAAVIALLPAAAAAQASHVSLSINERGVTLEAHDASLREILAEWSRVGGTKVLNAEALDARPVTLSLSDVSERQALDILLRDIGGYILSARGAGDRTVSQFAGLVVVPRHAVSPASSTPPPGRTFAPRPTPLPGVSDEPGEAVDSDADQPRRLPLPRPVNGIAPGPGVRIGTSMPESEPITPATVPGMGGAGTGAATPSPFGRVTGAATPGVIIPGATAGPGSMATDPSVKRPVPQGNDGN